MKISLEKAAELIDDPIITHHNLLRVLSILVDAAKEQETRLTRYEYHLADLYDRMRRNGLLEPADEEFLARLNDLIASAEARR